MVRANRKTVIMVFFATLMTYSVCAHEQELFLQANALYVHGDYQRAIDRYQSISRKGAGVYLNLGNAYYHQGDLVSALIQWKKAQRLARGALLRTVLEHIALVEQQLHLSPSLYTSLFIKAGPYITFIPMIALQLLWLVLMIILLLSTIRKSGSRRIVTVAVLLFACALVSSAMAMKHVLQLPACAVVCKSQAPLFAGPNNQYHTMSTLSAGSQVSICQQGSTWCKIACDNTVGWIETSALVVV